LAKHQRVRIVVGRRIDNPSGCQGLHYIFISEYVMEARPKFLLLLSECTYYVFRNDYVIDVLTGWLLVLRKHCGNNSMLWLIIVVAFTR